MIHGSRRLLARYGADLIAGGESRPKVARLLASALLSTGTQKDYRQLADDVTYQLEASGKMAHAQVTSATPLSPNARRELSLKLKKAAGVDKVIIEQIIDSSVIGGIKVETATRSWDNTISGALKDMKKVFK